MVYFSDGGAVMRIFFVVAIRMRTVFNIITAICCAMLMLWAVVSCTVHRAQRLEGINQEDEK